MSTDPNTAAGDSGGKPPRKVVIQYGGRAADKNNEAGHLAEQFLLQNYTNHEAKRLLHCFNEQFYKYTGTHYKKINEPILKDKVYKFVRENSTEKRSSGLLDVTWKFVRSEIRLAEEREYNTWLDQPPQVQQHLNCVALQNGILNLDAPEAGLRPHTPDWFSLTCLPFNYEPEARWDNWQVTLEHNLENDEERIALLQEWFGYCLTPDTSQHKALLMYGTPRGGKGTTMHVLRTVLGAENVAEVRLRDFRDKFRLSMTAGKLVNVAEETGRINFDEETFKSFIAADPMVVEEKFCPPYKTIPTARVVIVTNELPEINDPSGGTAVRLMYLPFQVDNRDKEDPLLLARLLTEADGVFNWALEGRARLREQGKFTVPAVSKAAKEAHILESNNVQVFFLEHCSIGPQYQCEKTAFYIAYAKWARESGYKPIHLGIFGRELKRLMQTYKAVTESRPRTAVGERTRTIDGIAPATEVIQD